MDTDKIKQVIDSGETQEVEFKESFHSSQKISELMCGFANTYGGVIILGVTKNKEVIGVSGNLDEIQQKISSSAQAVSPPILPSIEVHEIDSKKVIAIIIQRAIDNSFHTFQGILWAKVGSTLKRIEGNQIVDFLRHKQILCFDESPSDAKTADIDIEKIKSYLSLRKQGDYFKSHSLEDFLVSTKLATMNGSIKIKNSALLFFAKNPTYHNPQIEIKLVRFEGTDPVKIIAHQLIQADLIEAIEKSFSFPDF